MIYSFSHRTDGPALYWDWFLNRLDAGEVKVRNPYYPDKVSTYDLSGDACEGFTFTSKDYRRVVDGGRRRLALARLVDGHATMWSATITPYRHDVEPGSPTNREAVEAVKSLSSFTGRDRVTWMYSPVAIWEDAGYTWGHHIKAFNWIARELAPWVSRVSVDVLRVYEKVGRNAPELREPHKWELDRMLTAFSDIAKREGIGLHACPAHQDWSNLGVEMSPCMSLERFAQANGLSAKKLKGAKGQGLYETCPAGCIGVKDIAPYDSCTLGCRYCYANTDPQAALGKRCAVRSEMLLDCVGANDVVSHAKQRKYFKAKAW